MNTKSAITKTANLVLAAGVTVSILALAYVFYHYGPGGSRTFASRSGMILYYGAPAVMAGLFLASLRQKPDARAGLALLFVSVGLSVYAVEGLVFLFQRPVLRSNVPVTTAEMNELVRLAKSFGVDFDRRTKLQVVNDFRAKNIDAVPSVVPADLLKEQQDGTLQPVLRISDHAVLPLGGIANKVTVLCNELGEYLNYQSDEHGFHNPNGVWSFPRADVVAIGDSYVHGVCVPSHENLVALVRKRYPATVNLGVSGNGPLLELATLMEYGSSLRPKVVLWFFYEGNDLQNAATESNAPLLMRYFDSGFKQGIVKLQPDIDAALTAYVDEARDRLMAAERLTDEEPETMSKLQGTAKELLLLSHLRKRMGLIYGKSGQDEISVLQHSDLLQKVLIRAKEAVEEWEGRLYLVYLPETGRYVDRQIRTQNEAMRERIHRIAESTRIPMIDIVPAFEAHDDPLALFPFRLLGHYNQDGNRLVAERVLQVLTMKN